MSIETELSGRITNFRALMEGRQILPDAPEETQEAKEIRLALEAEKRKERNTELLLKGGYTKRSILAAESASGASIIKAATLTPKVLSDGILLLLGPTGRGKTVMATWWAMRRQEKGLKCGKFMTARSMFSEVKSTFGGHLKRSWIGGGEHVVTEDGLLDSWSCTPFLVIDEVQTRTESTWEDGMLEEVINARYGAMLPTVLIANLDIGKAQESLGPRIMDRANECGGIVSCDWASYR